MSSNIVTLDNNMAQKTILMSSVVVFCSCIVAIASTETIEHRQNLQAPTIQILESTALRAWCIVGSIIGAWIMISCFEKAPLTAKNLSMKFVSSAASGLVFTPAFIHYSGLPKTVDIVAGVSTLVSIFAISVLTQMGPSVVKFFKRKLGDND